ncbi:MAG TPA: coenzyme F420-0:L-glutamate ligase [Thermomicrobiales bacterium]|nr:coenzyme F420-0:L-glutamate ligase [Thermomicrobiales bacterium]
MSEPAPPSDLSIFGLDGMPEVRPGDDLPALIAASIEASGVGLAAGDVLVVTHKIVSKAEGQLVRLTSVTPSALAVRWAEAWSKDARQVEVVLREARRIVRMERGIIIAETRHGFVCANAGVDASNVEAETVCLLPPDPDGSAAALRAALGVRFGLPPAAWPGVVVSDSFGRPWRNGIVNVAIGAAGIAPLIDYRGQHDAAGYELHVTVLAVADELAAASELVMHKLAARPVALIRGYQPPLAAAPGTGRDLIMDPTRDLFR